MYELVVDGQQVKVSMDLNELAVDLLFITFDRKFHVASIVSLESITYPPWAPKWYNKRPVETVELPE